MAVAGYSAYSAAHAASQRKKAEKSLESQVNGMKPNSSILDYYNKALARYNPNAYNNPLYNQQKQNIERGTATGIAGLQDRRSGLAGISSLVQGQNDGLLRAAATAEGQQGQQLSQLGGAAAAKQRDDNYRFSARYNLTAQKAAGQAQVQNAATQNAVSNFESAAAGATDYYSQENRFNRQYGKQGENAYGWAQDNNMGFGKYRRMKNNYQSSFDTLAATF